MLYNYSADLGTIIDGRKLCEVSFNFPLSENTIDKTMEQTNEECLNKIIRDTLYEYKKIVSEIFDIHKELKSNYFDYMLTSTKMINKLTNFKHIKPKIILEINYKTKHISSISGFMSLISANAVFYVFNKKKHEQLMNKLQDIYDFAKEFGLEDISSNNLITPDNIKKFGKESRDGESVFDRVSGHIYRLKKSGLLKV